MLYTICDHIIVFQFKQKKNVVSMKEGNVDTVMSVLSH